MNWIERYANYGGREISPGIHETEDGVVIDTAAVADESYADYFLKNAGWFAGGAIHAIHVTDSPDDLIAGISSGTDVMTVRGGFDVGDFGGGLYGSNAPQLWEGRATGKYDFLGKLSDGQRRKLGQKILGHANMREKGYLSESEREFVERLCKNWMEGTISGEAIITLAGQPYNIRFWEPEFLTAVGIEPSGKQPQMIEFEAVGKFVKVDGGLPGGEVSRLRQKYDGAFISGGMSYPQLVVWKNEALRSVRKFNDPYS